MKYRESRDVDVQVDIAPMIDIVFILLIFFMVTTTFVKDMKVELDRPSAASASSASSKAIRLFIDKNSDVFLDGEPVRIWLIQSKLRDLLASSTDKTVLVISDEGVASGKLIEVIDQARLSGAQSVAVATEKEAG